MLAPNTLLQNRYLILRQIGQGGMGAVYEARDQRLGSTVALKETLFKEEHMRKAFEREARLLANLRHPGLPKVSDHFAEEAGQFLVMEFISGADLGELLKRRGVAFSPAEVVRWCDQLLDVLEYLHQQDPPIIHRDIKPQNLKLTDRSEIILLDFGLAKGTLPHLSSPSVGNSVFGYTPHYAPPEQMQQGVGTDARSDLYALAATMYHLLTGKKPDDAVTRAMNQPDDPLRLVHHVNPQVSSEIGAVLHGAMALKPEKRLQTAAEMRRALAKVGQPEPSFRNSEAKTAISTEAKTAVRPHPSGTSGDDAPTWLAQSPSPNTGWTPSALPVAPPAERQPSDTIFIAPRTAQQPANLPTVKIFVGHLGGINCVAHSPGSRSVFSGSQDTTIRLWSVESGQELFRFTGHSYSVESVALSADSRLALSGSRDGTVRLWYAHSGQEIRRFSGHKSVVHSVALSPDGRLALSGSGDKTIKLWDLETGRELGSLKGHTNSVTSVTFSPDGQSVLSGSYDQTARLWNLEQRKEIRTFRHWDGVGSVVFSPDGSRALSGSADKTIYLWDVESGHDLLRFEGHTDSVTSVAFSPDGRYILSGSSDGTVRLWDIENVKEILCLEGHKYGVTSVAFSPDGRRVLSGSWDKTLRLWELPT